MLEEYDLRIPDVSAYLRRIGIDEPAEEIKPDLKNLGRLIWAHQTHVPFENLDGSILKQAVQLDIPTLYHKIVEEKRGGYCFELNGLFARLLSDLGYTAFSVFCRIRYQVDGIVPKTHRAVIVSIGGKDYYCDVGYGGPQPAGPVLMESGKSCAFFSGQEQFAMEQNKDGLWTLKRYFSETGWQPVLQFYRHPQLPIEFIPVNYYCSAFPEFACVRYTAVSIRMENGFKSLNRSTFTVSADGQKTEIPVSSENHFRQLLKEEFGIIFPADR